MTPRSSAGIVIIGAGQAGYQVASSVRLNGYDGPVTIVGDESAVPYQRPPLSKDYLTAPDGMVGVNLAEHGHYAEHEIELLHNDRAVTIRRADRTVELASGRRLPYDRLVLATGVTARRLSVDGHDLAGVHTLRTESDARAIRTRLARSESAVVIGGGVIGLEFASVARHVGVRVSVLEVTDGIMTRMLLTRTAQFLARRHQDRGVDLRTDTTVVSLAGRDGHVTGVRLSTGEELPADLVIVGVGVTVNSDLARDAGLAVGDGIVVDGYLRTSDSSIFAIGDCARYPSRFAGGMVRLESVQNATDQARCVADTLTGQLSLYEAVPWFWTHQAGAKVQIVGLSTGHDHTVVREAAPDRFSVFCYRGTDLVAVESVDRPADHMATRRLMAAGINIPPALAVDPNYELKHLLQTTTA